MLKDINDLVISAKNAQNSYEYINSDRTIIKKVPRRVGKTTLIKELACKEKYPFIVTYSFGMAKCLYGDCILHNRAYGVADAFNHISDHKVDCIFFDEVEDTACVEKITKLLCRDNNIKYVVNLYTPTSWQT